MRKTVKHLENYTVEVMGGVYDVVTNKILVKINFRPIYFKTTCAKV